VKILLTGGTGFLGSHIGARLLADGHELTLLARGSAGASAGCSPAPWL
jgi:nucleoside-diphosphate-sugar epimerase